jgi:hypothetical protein
MNRLNGHQLRLPGLSLKVRGNGKRAPELATFRLPALSTPRFECDVDTELQLTLTGPDGETIVGYYLRCDAVGFKKHRPAKGHPWIERIHTLAPLEASDQVSWTDTDA